MGALVRSERDNHFRFRDGDGRRWPHLFKELQYNVDSDVVAVAMIARR
jgi:hypothetical protein